MYRAIIALNGLCYLSPARRSRSHQSPVNGHGVGSSLRRLHSEEPVVVVGRIVRCFSYVLRQVAPLMRECPDILGDMVTEWQHPNWLIKSGPVSMKRHIRNSKYDPLVEDVTLIYGNAGYAYIRVTDDLAPAGDYNFSKGLQNMLTRGHGKEDITEDNLLNNRTKVLSLINCLFLVSEIALESDVFSILPLELQLKLKTIAGSNVRDHYVNL
ncbi:hypothetical protein J6590_089012 [Homalodisca vitripennis]|nr:hypothetical protein J6590_089012 [Homalodisca vitripennis]